MIVNNDWVFSHYRIQFLFKPKPGEQPKDNKFYRRLYPQIIQDIEVSDSNIMIKKRHQVSNWLLLYNYLNEM